MGKDSKDHLDRQLYTLALYCDIFMQGLKGTTKYANVANDKNIWSISYIYAHYSFKIS